MICKIIYDCEEGTKEEIVIFAMIPRVGENIKLGNVSMIVDGVWHDVEQSGKVNIEILATEV